MLVGEEVKEEEGKGYGVSYSLCTGSFALRLFSLSCRRET